MDSREYLTKAQEAEAMADAAKQPGGRAHWETITRGMAAARQGRGRHEAGKVPHRSLVARFASTEDATMHEDEIRASPCGILQYRRCESR